MQFQFHDIVLPHFRSCSRPKTIWTEEQRRTVWFLISSARQNLKIAIDPIVATAFIILQRYFRGESWVDNDYDLFVLMSAALFHSCKVSGKCYKIDTIVQELCRICCKSRSGYIKNMIGSHFIQPGIENLSQEEINLISAAEVDLIRANNFNTQIDLPFSHFEKWKQSVVDHFSNSQFTCLCNKVMIDMCLLICSCYYLDVPPEVAAAAAASKTFGADMQWIEDVKSRYGNDVFELALNLINIEDSKTMKRKPQPHPQQTTCAIIRSNHLVFI